MLERIFSPADIKALSARELEVLAADMRALLIRTVTSNGGHLASNLGTVELTIALHRVLETPTDAIFWDVGHQAYNHKMLTGRWEQFPTLRTFGGLGGFPNPQESEHDAFIAGHASTAVSAALGFARAKMLTGEKGSVVAVVGDGALGGGMCYEALNDAGDFEGSLVVVLNDNEMSIDKNVGALSMHLSKRRISPRYMAAKRRVQRYLRSRKGWGEGLENVIFLVKNSIKHLFVHGEFFEALGFTYIGPIDGHDVGEMAAVLRSACAAKRPVLVHVATRKGQGFEKAEAQPEKYHGLAPYYVEKDVTCVSLSHVMGQTLCTMAKEDTRIVAVTAAMKEGTGLAGFGGQYGARLFDVGIAEQHALTMAAGMAKGGLRPFVAIYSSFLQRSYDQIVNDVCLLRLPVVLLIDRAGLAGEDGVTHHGIYDLAYLRNIPGICIMAPASGAELARMMTLAMTLSAPVAIRYEKSGVQGEDSGEIALGSWVPIGDLAPVRLLCVGAMVKVGLQAAELLAAQGVEVQVVNARFIKPLDEVYLANAKDARLVVTLEEHVLDGGFGSAVSEHMHDRGIGVPLLRLGIGETLPMHGTLARLREEVGLDAPSVAQSILCKIRGCLL